MQALSVERSGHAQTFVVAAVTLAALALLGLVLAYWTWAWFAPRPALSAPAAAEPTGRATAAGNLFGDTQRNPSGGAPAGMAIKLLGVVAASGGQRGYAILVVQFETRQMLAVREGEDIAPGIRLAEVHADHVILDRNGKRETLAWPEKTALASPSAPLINK